MIVCRRCTERDVPRVMAFIDQYWRAGHALAVSRSLMDWQHAAEDGNYNYLLAEDDGRLLGVLGYIPSCRYDPALSADNVLWLALWKVREDAGVSGVGLKLLASLRECMPHKAMAVSGINPTHPPMYRALGYMTGQLTQYVTRRPGPLSPLLTVPSGDDIPVPRDGTARAVAMDEASLQGLSLASQAVPRKSPRYFLERYIHPHPYYRYKVYRLVDAEGSQGLVAYRVAEHQGHRALRMVDFSGDAAVLAQAGPCLSQWLAEEDAGYADFWQYGIDESLLERAGFVAVNPDGAVVVPNFFEPFIARNARLEFAVRPADFSSLVMCRADGDQDRPNDVAACHS